MRLGWTRLGRALAGAMLAGSVASPAWAQAPTPSPDAESELVGRINMMRDARDLPALERHPGLDGAARVHSQDMASREDLAHLSPETGDPATRVAEAGVEAKRVGENIAQGADPMRAHQSIIESDPHREQLLDARFTHVGVGVVRDEQGRAWVTQVLAALVEDDEPEAGDVASEAPAEAEPPPPSWGQPEPRPDPPQAEPPPAPQAPTAAAPSRPYVRAYWVHDGNRWWYYPVPADARPGDVLEPDPSVQGPPPPTARQSSRVRVYVHGQPPLPPPPQRHYHRPRPRPRVFVRHRHGHHPHVRFHFGFRIGH